MSRVKLDWWFVASVVAILFVGWTFDWKYQHRNEYPFKHNHAEFSEHLG